MIQGTRHRNGRRRHYVNLLLPLPIMPATSNGKLHPDGAQALFHGLDELTNLGVALAQSAQVQVDAQKDRLHKKLGKVAAKNKEALKKKQEEDRLTRKLEVMEEAISKTFDGGTFSAQSLAFIFSYLEEKAQEILKEAGEVSSSFAVSRPFQAGPPYLTNTQARK